MHHPFAHRLLPLVSIAAGLAWLGPQAALAQGDNGPIKIGVVSEFAAVVGEPIAKGAELAADNINAHGGINGRKLEIIAYDDHSSAAEAVRDFQRLAEQDHVSAVITTFISEVALAIEPWAARLHMPTLTPAAASNLISKQVHDHYSQYKYMFEGWFPSPNSGIPAFLARHKRIDQPKGQS
jgi:branched-chain amino acid transport system substrate-binding protein